MLGEDFLSPTVATLLFPDMLQRFIPIPIYNDRAITLEQSWERAWRQSGGSDDFTEPFGKLWQSTEEQENVGPPLLLLNSTVVETGKRLIMNPLRLETNDLQFAEVFRDAIDGVTLLGDKVPLSTAVHLSARFTYVSPAGKVFSSGSKDRDPSWFRLVDGGYFENSGAVTATELLDAVVKYNQQKQDVRLKPFIIHISNEPVVPDSERKPKQISFNPIMGELLSPLRALLHDRPARGFQAREFLQRQVEDEESKIVRHVHFLLCKGKLDLPLGWMLSDAVQEDLISQFSPTEDEADTKPYNLVNMDLVLQHLSEGKATGKSSSVRESEEVKRCRGLKL
jgi:hypothetical protein